MSGWYRVHWTISGSRDRANSSGQSRSARARRRQPSASSSAGTGHGNGTSAPCQPAADKGCATSGRGRPTGGQAGGSRTADTLFPPRSPPLPNWASAEELLQLADLAMFSAKGGRIGAAVFDDARDGEGRHRLETVEQLRAGIATGALVLHHQPKLDLRTGEVDGVEALVRWAHPDRGLLAPDAFIDLAES